MKTEDFKKTGSAGMPAGAEDDSLGRNPDPPEGVTSATRAGMHDDCVPPANDVPDSIEAAMRQGVPDHGKD